MAESSDKPRGYYRRYAVGWVAMRRWMPDSISWWLICRIAPDASRRTGTTSEGESHG